MDSTAARRAAGIAAGIILAAVGTTGCAALQGGTAKPAPTSVRTVTVTASPATTAATTPPSTNASDDSGDDSSGGDSTATETTSRKPAPPTITKPQVQHASPKIESFTVVTKPSCPVVGTPDAPFSSPGNGVVIAWKVTGAPGAAISVDSPGMYAAYGDDYPATGQLELAFPCDGGSGDTTHTYTVWPKGAKGVSKTLTVSARNNS